MTATALSPSVKRKFPTVESQVESLDRSWRPLCVVGAIATLVTVALIPVQIVIFVLWPPPLDGSALDWFELFQDNWLRGLLGLDLLYIVTNALLIPHYLALYVVLRRASQTLMAIALTSGLVGLTAYFSSTVAFEMWSLSQGYADASSASEQAIYLSAGEAMLASFQGTAFIVYYLLNGVALLLIALAMLRSTVFSRRTAYAGLVAAALMAVPSVFGTIGMVFAFASLLPWAVFSILAARQLLELGKDTSPQRLATTEVHQGLHRRE